MDPNNQNPQGDSEAVKKLESDLEALTQKAKAEQTLPTEPVNIPEEYPTVTNPTIVTPPVVPTTPDVAIAQPQTPEVPPKPAKKSSPLMVVAIILIILAVLSVVVYVFGSKFINPKPVSTPTPIAVVTPTPDSTANWKTYTDQINNYSFKYPDGWETYVITGGTNDTLMVAPKAQVDKVKNTQGSFGGGQFLTMTINITPSKLSIPQNDEFQQVTSEAAKIDGVDALRYSTNIIQDMPGFSAGDRIISVRLNLINKSYMDIGLVDSSYQDVFNQILSTFKFISASPSASPTGSLSTPTPTARPWVKEEELLRKTVAGFEMYVGNSNTAGALTFFTPPISDSAKLKFNSIKAKDLPFRLTSWSFIWDANQMLAAEEIKNGYRVRTSECRTTNQNCLIYFIELVRSNEAENGFSVDRYYRSQYGYQNNLGEEIKYDGFEL
jgi:hypothetical protein